MSMGFLSRIGIGSAEVDTILETETVEPGNSVPARIEIEGGSEDQTVEAIEVAVMTRYKIETDDGTAYSNVAIHESQLTDGFTIEEGEQRTIDAGEIQIPETTPVTLGNTEVWIHTGLDIDWSVDPDDTDHLEIEPDPYRSATMDAVEDLGFSLHTVENIDASRFGPHRFAQEFEYRPQAGSRYASDLDEIELVPVHQGDSLDVIVEVDKSGFSILDSDESHHRITIESTDSARIVNQIGELIDAQLE
jgi:sporulation-control protein